MAYALPWQAIVLLDDDARAPLAQVCVVVGGVGRQMPFLVRVRRLPCSSRRLRSDSAMESKQGRKWRRAARPLPVRHRSGNSAPPHEALVGGGLQSLHASSGTVMRHEPQAPSRCARDASSSLRSR